MYQRPPNFTFEKKPIFDLLILKSLWMIFRQFRVDMPVNILNLIANNQSQSIFRNRFASISKIFIFAGELDTGLSSYKV